MIEEQVIESNGCRYIEEFMKDLPDNVMFNKVTTGCGMTSLVLKNDLKYVLAVPFVSLIKNKEQWCKEEGIELCSVYSDGADKKTFKEFGGKKIIVTYDSLEKVTKWLDEMGDLKEWKLCIDEAHKIVDSAAFRPNAINSVLSSYPKYKSFVFGTATPVKHKYQLPSLKHIPRVRIQWDNLESVKVNYSCYDEKINDVAAILALDFINGERVGNAHIFINSVKSICDIIRKMQKGGFINHGEIRVVCANTDRNQTLIDSKLPKEYCISPVGCGVKKVNFYTSTAFEGCDIYDKDGRNFIITDGNKGFTKIDIVTVLPQIIGRVRNSMYNNTVDLIYTKNKYFYDETEEEFEKKVHHNINEAKKDVLEFNDLRPESTHRINALEKNDNPYLLVDGDQLCLNDNSWYNEMHNFSTMKKTYYVSKDGTESTIVDGTTNYNGLDYDYEKENRIEIKGLNKVKLGRTPSFKDLCIDCIEVFEGKLDIIRSAKIVSIERDFPLIYEAYYKLGVHKMKALEYRKKPIEEALLVSSNGASVNYKIVKLLDLKIGQRYSRKEVKAKLEKIYLKLEINKKAKATDLGRWFEYRDRFKRINGVMENGLVIIGCKVKLTK
jgi:hypothetical protein